MKRYTQREFLKMLGATVAFLPFLACFDQGGHGNEEEHTNDSTGAALPPAEPVSDADVILLMRDDEAYSRFSRAYNKRLHYLPKYIAVCKTEKGVRFAVKKAARENLQVAVRSGGHSFEGFSSNNGGMMINLSLMRKITWLPGDQVLVEPGCLLEDIQKEFADRKRLLPAGSCGTVGIGGLTLGGGYGFFSRKFGLTCDSLLQVQMTGAGGVHHDSDRDPELLWGCRGGGNGNFGVITAMKFRHYPMPAAFSAHTLKFSGLNRRSFSRLLDTWFSVTATLPPEAFSAFVLNGSFLTMLFTTFGPDRELEELLTGLIKAAGSYRRSVRQPLPAALKRYYGRKGPLYFKNASGGMYRGREDLAGCREALFEKVASAEGIIFQINTLGGRVDLESFRKGSCFPHRGLPYLSSGTGKRKDGGL